MENVVKNFDLVKEEISNFKNANIVAVSKTFPIGHILPLINHGHQHFGENKVQEAQEKWTSIKIDFPQLKLHLIGKLQTNKVKFALPLFDYIHSLDSIKLAEKISLEQEKKNFKPKIFIQINLGKESQKSGIDEDDLDFEKDCLVLRKRLWGTNKNTIHYVQTCPQFGKAPPEPKAVPKAKPKAPPWHNVLPPPQAPDTRYNE